MALHGIAHKNITDPQLHELKGASTAQAGQVPFADGAGHTSWQYITPDSLDLEATELTEADQNSSTAPVSLDVLGLPGTPSDTCTAAVDFSGVNQNTLNVASKVNSVLTYVSSLQTSYNALVLKYNALLSALESLGFISIGE